MNCQDNQAKQTKTITFPASERLAYQKRLDARQPIFTTRVSDEVGRYQKGAIYHSEFGKLRVIYLRHFRQIEDHPFYHELTQPQIAEITAYLDQRGYDVVGLDRVA